jgi:RNA polymerase sigma factor (sigma-70 family)
MNKVIQHIRSIALLQAAGERTDGQLLESFVRRREGAALEALVRRHSPMVWGVCLRILRNHHDAEDAFQATFLVLVRKAATVKPREMVGNWLYGVAHQTALKARATRAKRQTRERQMVDAPEPAVKELDLCRDLLPVLDQELSRLPDKYRVAIVLCDLEGKTRKEAARQLGCPEGTLAARLTRGRVMLAKRLTRRGVVLSGGALAAVLSQQAASAVVPASVVVSTIKAASLLAAGKAAATGVISVKVAALTEGVLRTMLHAQIKIGSVILVAVLALGGATAVLIPAALGQDNRPGVEGFKAVHGKVATLKEDPLKSTLVALDKALWDAFAKGEPELARKLYADEYVGIGEHGRFDKQQSVDSFRLYRPADLKIRDVELIRVGNATAILTYVYSVKLLLPSGELDGVRKDHRISKCWTQRDGGWVLVFTQDSATHGE